jgi:hypothetical protein
LGYKDLKFMDFDEYEIIIKEVNELNKELNKNE